jgi:hypothetical protein
LSDQQIQKIVVLQLVPWHILRRAAGIQTFMEDERWLSQNTFVLTPCATLRGALSNIYMIWVAWASSVSSSSRMHFTGSFGRSGLLR